MGFSFLKEKKVHPVVIKGEDFDIVSEYKYLGVVLDNKSTWSNDVDVVFKKTQSHKL